MADSGKVEVDGARGVLFPALLAPAWEPSLSREQYFERGKKIGIAAVLTAWVGLLFLLRRSLRPATALTVWWALGFTVFMFYAPYVKAEGLFYALALASFVSLLELLHRPRWTQAVVAGIFAGAAQLTKEVMLASLGLFCALQLLVALLRAIGVWRASRAQGARAARAALRPILRRALSVPIVVGVFLLTVYPQIHANKQVFGHYFYNVNSYFYVWYDSWGEVKRGTRAHSDRSGWPEMPPEQLPSLEKYLATHSAADIRGRIERGASGTLESAMRSHGFFEYVCLSLLAAAATVVMTPRLRRWLVRHWHLVLFALLYFVGYYLSFSWFYVLNPGVRFVLALAGPLIFAGAWLSDRGRGRPFWFGTLGLWTIAAGASLLVDVPVLVGSAIERAKGVGM